MTIPGGRCLHKSTRENYHSLQCISFANWTGIKGLI